MLEDTAERVAEGRPAAVTDVERAHRVRGDELNLHRGALAELGAAVVGALLAHGAEDGVAGSLGEVEVDEAGAGNLNALHLVGLGQVGHDGLGDGTRRLVGELGAPERHGARPVAVGGICRALEAEVAHLELGQVAGLLGTGDGLTNQILDRLDHRGPLSCTQAAPRGREVAGLAAMRLVECSKSARDRSPLAKGEHASGPAGTTAPRR